MQTLLTFGLFLRIPSDLAQKEDEDKTSVTTPFEVYCYTRMPEGIKQPLILGTSTVCVGSTSKM